ncbi:MAG: aminotransferase class IV, partial [Bacilli bacterium]
MIVWCNGKFIEENELQISPLDHGYLYGIGAFETFRTFDGKVLNWDYHMERLHQALAMCNIVPQYSGQQLREVIRELIVRNQLSSAYFRLNVSAGEAPIGLKTTPYAQPTYILFVKTLG